MQRANRSLNVFLEYDFQHSFIQIQDSQIVRETKRYTTETQFCLALSHVSPMVWKFSDLERCKARQPESFIKHIIV